MPNIAEIPGSAVLGPEDGKTVWLGAGLGVRFMIRGEATGGLFSLVEHPIAPRFLAAPLHTHAHEDEYSYVLEGRVGFQLGDEVVYGGPGDLVFKPRGVPHAFWNDGDEQARILEVISPAGFERFFEELAATLPEDGEPDAGALGALFERYSLDMRFETAPELAEKHGLVVDAADAELAAL